MRHLGVIVPSSNTSTEIDFAAWAPPEVALHSARMWMVDATLEAAEAFVDDTAPKAARDLGTLEPDAVVFACTAAGATLGKEAEERLVERLGRLAGAPVVSTNAAVAVEMASHAPKRIAVITPYTPDITEGVAASRERDGYEVIHAAGMQIELNRDIGRVEPERLVDFATSELIAKRFDLIFVSCTNLRTADAIRPLEDRFAVPVVTSNGASMRAALDLLGLDAANL
jgi:maleate isomerase